MSQNTTPASRAARFKAALDAAGAPAGRKRAGWVARTFDVSPQMAQRWIKGTSSPRDKEREICRRLNINSEWLRDGHGPMHSGPIGVSEPAPSHYLISNPPDGTINADLYGARLAWQAFVHRGLGYITAGDLHADDIDALDKIMRQLAQSGSRRPTHD